MARDREYALTDGSRADQESWPSPKLGWYAVAVLVLAYIFSFIDRVVLSLLVPAIKADMGLSDTAISYLQGLAFVVFYSTMGVPVGWLADRVNRTRLIATGIALWSAMTAACGMAQNYAQLFLARMGVGVGEAALSPAAYSVIADYFPKERLGRALGVYTAGAFFGAGIAFLVGGAVLTLVQGADSISLPLVGEIKPWQFTFIAVGLPGLLVALLALTIREPVRRGVSQSQGPSFRKTLAYVAQHPKTFIGHFFGFAMLAVHFNIVVGWAPTYMSREFNYSPAESGFALGMILLIFSAGGVVAGGMLADRMHSRGLDDGTLRVGIFAAIMLTPLSYVAFQMPTVGLTLMVMAPVAFFASFGFGAAPTAIQLAVPNTMRGQVSAMYLFVMNLVGVVIGLSGTAWVTDYFFADDMRIGDSMSLVGFAAGPAAALLLFSALQPYRHAVLQLRTDAQPDSAAHLEDDATSSLIGD
jgi:MFS family permease